MSAVRQFPADFSASAVAAIDQRLAKLAAEHEVTVPLAIESGSRAWGFSSPDSDYDCRFIFVRPVRQLLSLWPLRDVIETPLDKVLDVSGWELGKAIKLLLGGNAVVIEWLQSPITYIEDQPFRHQLLGFANRHADRGATARHYLHLGERQRRTYFGDGKDVELKKIFYALRPAAALRWMRLHTGAELPPMHFPTLIDQGQVPSEIASIIADLIAQKAITREIGSAPLPAAIASFIDSEFAMASELPPRSKPVDPAVYAEADRLYAGVVAHFELTRRPPAP